MKKRKFSKERTNLEKPSEGTFSFGKSKTGFIIVAGIIFIMVFSLFAIGLGSDDENYSGENLEYNGFNLTNIQGVWYLDLLGIRFGFEYSPVELESLESVDLSSERFSGRSYVVFDPEQFSEASLEINRLRGFLMIMNDVVSPACIKEEGCGDLPIVDCEDDVLKVFIRNGENSSISKEGSCIVLDSKYGEEQLVINRFMYGILGVM